MTRLIGMGFLLLAPLLVFSKEDVMLGLPDNTLSWMNPASNTGKLEAKLAESDGQDKVLLLCELSFALQKSGRSGEHYMKYLSDAWQISEELSYSNGKAIVLFLRAGYYDKEKNDPIQSLRTLQKAETIFDHTTHWSLKHRVWSSIWRIYQVINKMDSAVLYYHKPLRNLSRDTAWYSHLMAHSALMRHASISNDHGQTRFHMGQSDKILRKHFKYIALEGFNLLTYLEELSIIMENYGDYRNASGFMFEVLGRLNESGIVSSYTAFYRAKILGRIARIYSNWGKNDSAFAYFDLAIRHFDRFYVDFSDVMDKPGMHPSYRLFSINVANQLEERAVVLIRTGEWNQAESDLMQSIKIRREQNDPLGVAMCYEKLGELHSLRGRFPDALEWYKRSLALIDSTLKEAVTRTRRDAKFVLFSNQSFASTYLKKGKLYVDWNKPRIAMGYYRQCLDISRDTGFQRCEAEALTAIGDIYSIMDKPDSTLILYNDALVIYQRLGYRPGMAAIYENMGGHYNRRGMLTEALNHYSLSQEIYEELDMTTSLAGILIKQGRLLSHDEASDKALKKLLTGLDIASKQGNPRLQMEAYLGLSDFYDSKNEIEKAYLYFRKSQSIKDTLFSLEIHRLIAETEAQYETNQSRQQLFLLEGQKELAELREIRTRMIFISVAGFMAMMLFGIFLYVRQNNLKRDHQLTLMQQRLLRSQMNPHFIFNSLGCIQSAIINEKPENAAGYLSSFAKLMRNILDSSENERIPLAREISTIKHYLALQKARFSGSFDYRLSGTEDLDADCIFIPPMLIQPFLENAIEHGIKHLESTGLISIAFSLNDEALTIEVEDNGIGRIKAVELSTHETQGHQSMAIDITRRRIQALNRRSKRNIGFSIIDLVHADGKAKGTRVVFGFPQ